MKQLIVLMCALVLMCGIAAPAGAGPVFLPGVTAAGGWSDVNKTSVTTTPDSLLCWAAAASDVLAYTGWRGWNSGTSSYIDTAAAVYAQFVAAWPDESGAATYAYEWWMTDRTQSIIAGPYNGGTTAQVFPSAGLDFYPTVNVQNGAGSVTAFVTDASAGTIYTYLGTYLGDERGIVASIEVPSGPGLLGPYSHAVTVWGYDPVADLMYITDSDDGVTGLRTYSFYQYDGQVYIQNYSNLYTAPTNVEITQLTRLNMNPGIDPQTTPTTVPDGGTTLVLLSGALAGLGALRRKFNV